ncbi:MAG: Rid family detoxifying hydrolase [Cryomorphaceae bacterium]|nr:Rid family detoxifying hydrolase [Flavobacteriales bacterium]
MKTIHSNAAPEPIGPYSQGIKFGETIFLSGQVAIDPETGKMDNESLESETQRVMKNIGALLKSQELDFSNVIKCSIFLMDMSQFGVVNEIYGSYFSPPYPARETVQVSKLPAGARVEISVIAGMS